MTRSATPKFPVSEEKMQQLLSKMSELGIREEDLQETFSRSSGRGGQHVNKTSTRVEVLHLPTGTTASCMKERSQSLNRFLARRLLIEKISVLNGLPTKSTLMHDKIRKQKLRRRRRGIMEKNQE